MTNLDFTKYSEFLRNFYLFNDFNDMEIQKLTETFEIIELQNNQILFKDGDKPDYFYLVFSGNIHLSQDKENERSQSWNYQSGEYFGEEEIIFGKKYSVSAMSNGNSKLLRLNSYNFKYLYHNKKEFRNILSAVIESRLLSKKIKLDWLRSDEILYLLFRKHEFFFFRSIIIPCLLAILSVPLFLFGTLNDSLFINNTTLIATPIILAFTILWGVWNWLNWGNDFYIITNQRVMWSEKIIGLYQSKREAPHTMILTVNVSTDQLGRWLDFGNVEVRTYTGGILMKNMPKPQIFSNFIKGYQWIAHEQIKNVENEAMVETIRGKFGLNEAIKAQISEENRTNISAGNKNVELLFGNLKQILNTFFKVRYEKGGVITYRKHWFVLLRKIGLSTMLLLSLITLSVFLLITIFSLSLWTFISSIWFFLIFIVLIVLAAWWGYQYLDWSNDIYRLTPEKIFDIEKKPLGKEEKKTASIESILSVEHMRKGIFEILFNYGKVYINVGQTQFTFNDVFNPGQVHQDIADYMQARNKAIQEIEEVREREHMAEWLKTYHDNIIAPKKEQNH